MGRPERPVDPDAGPVQRLAHQLRELRRAAGSSSYRAMAQTAGFSAATLSQAAARERLPSLAVVRGYACGADPAEWEARWIAPYIHHPQGWLEVHYGKRKDGHSYWYYPGKGATGVHIDTPVSLKSTGELKGQFYRAAWNC